MAELEARFETDPSQGWQRPLAAGETFVLGRHPGDGGWPTEWDNFISRQHASMTWDGQKVSGVINPGPESIPIKTVTIDFATWTVRLEAEGRG